MNIFQNYTLKSLKKNKTRTIVTIIGIILSVAMFTATTTALSSAQNYMLNYTAKTTGSFYLEYENVSKDTLKVMRGDAEIKDMTVLQDIGYANIGSENLGKPYLYIAGMDSKYTDLLALNLTSGRLPENENEIVIPVHLKSNGKVEYKLGDKITLDVGTRTSDEYTFWQSQMLTDEEKLTNTVKKTYTVVGIAGRVDTIVEPYDAPGYTAFTLASKDDTASSRVFLTTKHLRQVRNFAQERMSSYGERKTINNDYLSYSGVFANGGMMIFIYGFGAILIFLIMFGSIALIYNSFSISVSERTKQFGLLKSIGATKKQMMNSVYFEAAILCLIAVPFGLISGCAGIGITFACLGDKFNSALAFGAFTEGLEMKLCIKPAALIAAALISVITTLISAYIPAKRAIKITAIEAIRQSNDIKAKAKQVKTSKLTYKLFGFEGMIASKNFKRNKKRYRTTVISLFVSIVLFITASSLCSYFAKSFSFEYTDKNYDIMVSSSEDRDELFKQISEIDGIDASTHSKISSTDTYIESDKLNPEYVKLRGDEKSDFKSPSISTIFIDDEEFKKLLKDNNLNEADYFNKDKPMAVLYDLVNISNYDSRNIEHRYKTSAFNFNEYPAKIEARYYNGKAEYKGYEMTYSPYDMEKKGDEAFYKFEKWEENESGTDLVDSIMVSEKDCGGKKIDFIVGAKIEEAPYYASYPTVLIYPKSMEKTGFLKDFGFVNEFYIVTENPSVVQTRIDALLEEKGLDNSVSTYNYAESMQQMRSLITIIRVFSYGFITLISLIAATNVFNTINTNIGLRRREFAMLKSVGMTPKGFNRMMNFESILYGFKSLLFGLPVSVLITRLIYEISTRGGYEFEFYIPWASFAVAVISVFVVVFASMIYSMRKIKKDNPIDALKNENL